ncbi:MAG: hypothetical protein N2036_00865, partial [Bryobacteraceae bacterium]|nr:hypothetical protein [Bryobacteraceae bacterium]
LDGFSPRVFACKDPPKDSPQSTGNGQRKFRILLLAFAIFEVGRFAACRHNRTVSPELCRTNAGC